MYVNLRMAGAVKSMIGNIMSHASSPDRSQCVATDPSATRCLSAVLWAIPVSRHK